MLLTPFLLLLLSLLNINQLTDIPVHIDSVCFCEELGSGGSSCIVYKCIVDGWCCAVKAMDFDEVSRFEVEQFWREVCIARQTDKERERESVCVRVCVCACVRACVQ
jgi:hypothetical protein